MSPEEAFGDRQNDTLFEIRLEGGKTGQDFKTVASHFKLIHFPSKVAMWTHTTPLPEWAYRQQEINGNKQITPSSNVWIAEDIPSLPEDDARRTRSSARSSRCRSSASGLSCSGPCSTTTTS